MNPAWNKSLNSPCKDCPDRHEACWGKCEKYKAWRTARDEMLAVERERRLRDREELSRIARNLWDKKRGRR
jgi:predicted ATP-dependent serine protease